MFGLFKKLIRRGHSKIAATTAPVPDVAAAPAPPTFAFYAAIFGPTGERLSAGWRHVVVEPMPATAASGIFRETFRLAEQNFVLNGTAHAGYSNVSIWRGEHVLSWSIQLGGGDASEEGRALELFVRHRRGQLPAGALTTQLTQPFEEIRVRNERPFAAVVLSPSAARGMSDPMLDWQLRWIAARLQAASASAAGNDDLATE